MSSVQDESGSGRRFSLRRRLGVGGFGEVYLAEMSTASGFTKTVALKLLRTDVDDDEGLAERIRDEARLLGLLRHRSIVQADDLVTLDGRPAVVMEYVPGANLSAFTHPERLPEAMPARVCAQVVRQVAEALDAAWSRPSTVTSQPLHVLHRDIKPANVRITPDGEVKVLDFGIARSERVDRESHTRGYHVGSLQYMAPELLLGEPASPASDVYALGVTAFECLTRARFGTALEHADEHAFKCGRRLSGADLELAGKYADLIRELLANMLAFEPEDRLDARQVADAWRTLEEALPGRGLEAWAPDAVAAVSGDEGDGGELSGRVLTEGSRPASNVEPTMEMASPPGKRAVAVEEVATELVAPPAAPARRHERAIVLVVGLLIGFLAAGAWIMTQDDQADAPPASPVAAAPPRAAPTPAPEPQAEPEPEPVVEAEPVPTPEPEPALSPEPALEAAPAVEAPALTAPVTVKISSVPFGIAVQIDGADAGKTPLKLELPPGSHQVTFVDGDAPVTSTVEVLETEGQIWTYRRADGSVR